MDDELASIDDVISDITSDVQEKAQNNDFSLDDLSDNAADTSVVDNPILDAEEDIVLDNIDEELNSIPSAVNQQPQAEQNNISQAQQSTVSQSNEYSGQNQTATQTQHSVQTQVSQVPVQPVSEQQRAVQVQPPPVNENITSRDTQSVPIYETDIPKDASVEDVPFKVGDKVYHPKHGNGVIEAFSSYSNRILFCHILFDNVGRKIMYPIVSCIEKVS